MYELIIPDKIMKTVAKSGNQALIKKLISLGKNPFAYGEPLRGNLQGYFKAKIPPFRFVYLVNEVEKTVTIVTLGTRDKVYKDFNP